MTAGGFAGSILKVDLSSGQVRPEPLSDALAENFIGGLGLCVKLAHDLVRPGTEPLAPGNPIVIGAGPLVGTSFPAASRVYAVTRLPASRAIGWCGGGGVRFGCELKNAGWDHVALEGRAERPVYLKIVDDRIELKDAAHLWGLGINQTNQKLLHENGPGGVIAIGPAGENCSSFSLALIDRLATLGRGGFAAVMGAKNLKAVFVSGSRGIRVADRKRSNQLARGLLARMREYPYLQEWQELGLVKSLPLVPREVYEKIRKRRMACASCPIGDKDVIQIPDGAHQGLTVFSTSAVNLFIPMVHGIKDYREAVALAGRLDDYGLDIFEFFGLMALIRTLVDKGVIDKREADPEPRLDSAAAMTAWAQKVACREGLGEIIADGFERVIAEFGEPAAECAPALIKGMMPYVGPRAPLAWNRFGTMELGQVLDPRGPHVGASGSPTYFAQRPLTAFPKHLERMGVPESAIARILPGLGQALDPPTLKVGTLLKYSNAWFTMLGSLGVCARAQINRFYNARFLAEAYEAVTGIPTSLHELRLRVDRVWTLLRLMNLREGRGREDDSLPDKWFDPPGFKDYLCEKPASRNELEAMIEDYYHEWGWDKKTGVPTLETLKRLGLE